MDELAKSLGLHHLNTNGTVFQNLGNGLTTIGLFDNAKVGHLKQNVPSGDYDDQR